MTIPVHARPRASTEEARRILRGHFDRDGELSVLTGERDANFRVRSPESTGWLLEIANARERPERLEFEDELLRRLAGVEEFRFPEPVAGPVRVEIGGESHLCRLHSWVVGKPQADCRPRSQVSLAEVGRLLGTVADALVGFEHTASDRDLQWNAERTLELCAERREAIPSESRRALLDGWLERVGPALERASGFRRSVIQNDGNDHNVLCGPIEQTADGWHRPVVGLIDFGDAIENPTAMECAIGAAYAMLDREDPVAAAAAVVAGFHERLPLTEEELESLIDLAAARLCLSVCNSAVQQAQDRDNRYLSVSERAAWRALEMLDATPGELAHYRLRAACGLEACPSAPRVRGWLDDHRDELEPVVEHEGAAWIFDLGVGSREMGGGAPGVFDTARLTERLFGRMAAAGAELGIGRYDEARCWYGGDLFSAPSDEAPRRRTVHVGVDLFACAGTPLRAPLAGTVASATWNRGRLDYGPTLVLEHRPESDVRFWTLWGHLDPECLDHLAPGDAVEAGQRIASVGDFPDNGDWPPHLHLQLICDRLGRGGDFPGVVDPAQRDTWTSICPDPTLLLGSRALAGSPPAQSIPTDESLLTRRRTALSSALSVSYRRPLHIVRGWRQFLYCAHGQPFLDAVNNVPHVGHSHPRVVEAAAAQNALLNTNTRYLHESLVAYAERLVGLFPDPLSVAFLVCSGSEANELAVRIARTATGARGMVALEGGYHGNTSTLVDLSHYKHSREGGSGAPEWVRIAPMPDVYRGAHADADDPTRAYADEVGRRARELAEGAGLAGFLVEPLLGCGGQIVPPAGYLENAFEQVRAAGGLCIADEVQIGLGRVGSHLWAFEQQSVVPDIVTLGKPLGNGYPVAAVITTREIADAFDNGMEYFNTFGGNPVACEVGRAVLEVLEEEGLPDNARRVGDLLLRRLGEIAECHAVVGDVRGVGLYLGVELVRDADRREPAPEAASYVVNRMRERGILVSTDGPDHNVIKIKPPLCFDLDDAERLVESLDSVLGEDLPASFQR